ncbi:MAG: prepilin-type N-terminal cleavage/methylation domain-containing protein [Verrucomicrobiota bacterium]
MKSTRHPIGNQRGFTLIELLIVITIIAILAGLGLQVGPKVIEKARQTQARNDCVNLEAAIKGYFAEYGRYPVALGSRETWKSTSEFMDVLTFHTASPVVQEMNPRGLVFFEARKTTDKVDGSGFVTTTRQYNDPWGKPYEIILDTDFDHQVNVPNQYKQRGDSRLKKSVLVHSAGKDGDWGDVADNVASWK